MSNQNQEKLQNERMYRLAYDLARLPVFRPERAPASVHAALIDRVVDRQFKLEQEAQREDWHGQIVRRIGPRIVDPREMYL